MNSLCILFTKKNFRVIKREQLLFVFFLLCHSLAIGQPEIKRTYNWAFGDERYFRITEFSFADSGKSQIKPREGCASISDLSGNLLFYTDGETVWNKQHIIMSNGTGLYSQPTVTQSSIIIPWPGQPNKYLIFTNDYALFYSVIDMTLDNGLGEVTLKNILVIDNIGEQLTACYHKNKKDVWVITHQLENNALYSVLVNSDGVSSTPIRSSSLYKPENYIGSLKVSPNGKKVAFASFYGGVELLCFNNENGRLGRSNILSTSFSGAYSVEFSNDSKRLYVNAYSGARLSQYDLSGKWDDIKNTEFKIGLLNINTGQMQLAADGSIYISGGPINIGRIESPSQLGTNCNYNSAFYTYPNVGVGNLGMPNFISSYFDTDTLELDTTNCECYPDDGKLPLIPNVITPNGDETNQGFGFENENFCVYSLKVFNRWGEVLFQTEDPSIFFEGRTNNGKLLASGTYYIIFKYQLTGATTAHEYHGSIMVLGEDN